MFVPRGTRHATSERRGPELCGLRISGFFLSGTLTTESLKGLSSAAAMLAVDRAKTKPIAVSAHSATPLMVPWYSQEASPGMCAYMTWLTRSCYGVGRLARRGTAWGTTLL